MAGRPWTKEEESRLIKMYWDREHHDVIEKEISRSWSSIKIKLNRLGVKGRERPPMREEHKKLRSDAQKGKPTPWLQTPEVRAKCGEAISAGWNNPERRARGEAHLSTLWETSQPKAAAARRGVAPVNKGMKPWTWMRITEEAFYEMIGAAQKRRPTKPEREAMEIISACALPWRYVGDGQVWIAGKNPDFIHENEKVVLEIFGRFWHNESEIPVRRAHFARHGGYRTFFLWEDEVTEAALKRITEDVARFNELKAVFREARLTSMPSKVALEIEEDIAIDRVSLGAGTGG